MVAPADAAVDAAYRGIAKARDLIDLTTHQGEHPRIGATDVCPFIPLGETTMDECVALAQQLRQVDHRAMKGQFVRAPKLSDVPYPVQMEPNLVVEFYSR